MYVCDRTMCKSMQVLTHNDFQKQKASKGNKSKVPIKSNQILTIVSGPLLHLCLFYFRLITLIIQETLKRECQKIW